MAKQSAGILLYRVTDARLEVFLVHPGGPYWEKKDLGAWSIPKGEFDEDEEPLDAARREVAEETGLVLDGDFLPLTAVRQPSRKIIYAWAVEGDCDATYIKSNTFALEWPPKSGTIQKFPEVDRAGWFDINVAKAKLLKGQQSFLDELVQLLITRGLALSKRQVDDQRAVGEQRPLF